MSVVVEKNGIKMRAKDDNQLAAFLNNGWKKVEDDKGEEVSKQTQDPENESPKYKKSEISRMNLESLKKLAAELEIAGAEESTGEVLKASIIEKLGL